MNTLNCEAVRMALSAATDGHNGSPATVQLDDHLAHCADCRHEVEQLRGLIRLLDSQNRRASTDQLWNGIEARLSAQDIETMFVMTHEEYSFVSSRLIKEAAALGGDVSSFVPREVEKWLKKKFGPETKSRKKES